MATKKKSRTTKTKQPASDALPKRHRRVAPPVDSRPSAASHSSREDAGKLSALNAAALVLAKAAEPLNCQEMIAAMATKGLWTSPAGKTPAATLYSGILKEIRTKGAQSRFQKTARGKFAHT